MKITTLDITKRIYPKHDYRYWDSKTICDKERKYAEHLLGIPRSLTQDHENVASIDNVYTGYTFKKGAMSIHKDFYGDCLSLTASYVLPVGEKLSQEVLDEVERLLDNDIICGFWIWSRKI